ncbi:response regulator [Novipirellula sp. SH528]|uniref:response regulator n=1 Tax=Novipirellula sp. SH528 TaxID=3454466 RepID=UPI003FA0DF04
MRVLLIDDSRTQATICRMELTKVGFDVDYAESSAEALSYLNGGQRYDVIVQDLCRPPEERGEGWTFYNQQLCDICPDIPVIFYTGYPADSCFADLVKSSPNTAFLSKNATGCEPLIQEIQSIVSRKQFAK